MSITYLYVVLATALRLLPHPWNITPLGAMFLFSGATFRSKRASLLVPLAALLISDYAVIRFLYHGQYAWFSPYTWAGFLLVGLIGWSLRGKITWARVGLASVAGSTVFFAVSNFGVWMGAGVQTLMYPHTLGGLAECYVAALPFFRNSVFGDLSYTALMFGSYYLLMHRRAGATAQP
jgi:hypothetical protein